MRFLRILAAVLIGLSFISLPAVDAHAKPTAKELSKLRAKFQQATELEQAGNYAEALGLFREVGQIKMTPQVRYHIAFCEEKLGRLVGALGGYELAASDAAKVDPSFEKEVAARADDLRGRIPKLVVKRGDGAAAAKIEIDGVALGASSVGKELPMDPGPHEVRGTLSGREPFSVTVELVEKDVKTVEVVLKAAETDTPAVGGGTPAADSGAGNGKDQGPEKPPSKVLPFVIGGVGVASLAASGVFFLMRQSAIKELDDACGPNRNQCPSDKQSTYDKEKPYNTVSQVALGVGVVGVGVAVTLLLTQKPAKKTADRSLTWVPAAPRADAGMSLQGVF